MDIVCASPIAPNMVPSKALEDRSRAAPGGIRLLRGEIAGFRVLDSGRIPVSWGGFLFLAYLFLSAAFPLWQTKKVRYSVTKRQYIALFLLLLPSEEYLQEKTRN